MKGFTAEKEFEIGTLSSEELKRADELVHNKYSNEKWNFMR